MADPVDPLFQRQHLVATRAQALESGMSARQVAYRVAREEWRVLRRGAYQPSWAPRSWKSELMAVVLLTGGQSSHRSGIRLYGLDGARASWGPEVSLEHPLQKPMTGAIVHGSKQMDLFPPTRVDGIPVTPVARTLLDAAAVVPELLPRLIDDALRRRLTAIPVLWGTLIRHAARGRNGTVNFRAELERRRNEEAVPLSMWSRWVAKLLTDGGLPRPVFEHRIQRGADFMAQVDLAFPAWRVAVELDSVSFHTRLENFHRDPVRRNRIRNAGWHLIEVTWPLYSERPLELVATVAEALTQQGWAASGAA
ncbi:MAG: type IV toxin-antitoxin system AbiEi family antitoxin domain-containing protein [Actinomycetia bacterium]|nr:type IV toxin-antitoxin system AbiEi family antitoxin domain-containing protein [Actinomycetes bacterium]